MCKGDKTKEKKIGTRKDGGESTSKEDEASIRRNKDRKKSIKATRTGKREAKIGTEDVKYREQSKRDSKNSRDKL